MSQNSFFESITKLYTNINEDASVLDLSIKSLTEFKNSKNKLLLSKLHEKYQDYIKSVNIKIPSFNDSNKENRKYCISINDLINILNFILEYKIDNMALITLHICVDTYVSYSNITRT